MSNEFTFEIPGKPQPKQRARRGRNGRWYTPEATRRYERLAASCALAARPQGWVTQGRFELGVTLFMPDRRRRDADNCVKSIADGLNGVIWADDDQIVAGAYTKEIDPDNPRAVVTVTRIEKEEP